MSKPNNKNPKAIGVFAGFLILILLPVMILTGTLITLKNRNQTQDAIDQNPTVKIWRSASQTVEELPLEDIVAGVISAEMPASYEPEALKAQAVAARTYILKRLPPPFGDGASVHQGEAQICDDFNHCQAYNDLAQRQKKWGDKFKTNEDKIQTAVKATKGQVLTDEAQDQPQVISPSFHSTCGGYTEAAGDYWQNDVPSLQAVPCYWDSAAPRYLSKVFFSKADLAAKLKILLEDLPKLKITETSATGRVMAIECGAATWKGSAFRSLLGLNSTSFTWLSTDEGYLFTVQGFGHGVGMCQTGANGMAEAGKSYDEILHHYYTDVKITDLSSLNKK